jgi:orotidine-5'-phosphate decarboxylase
VDQLLIALDVETGVQALALADRLRGVAGGFKVGHRLFTAAGPIIVRTLAERGDRVFLDLKYHDIPNTVATAVDAAVSLGAWMINVHASGGLTMMQAARGGPDAAARAGRQPPLVIGVTVLTSMNAGRAGRDRRARRRPGSGRAAGPLAKAAGLDGVVASPQETAVIREACGPDFAIVTPGIRGGRRATSGKDDQERTMSAGRRSRRARATSWWGVRSSRRQTRGRPRRRYATRCGIGVRQGAARATGCGTPAAP